MFYMIASVRYIKIHTESRLGPKVVGRRWVGLCQFSMSRLVWSIIMDDIAIIAWGCNKGKHRSLPGISRDAAADDLFIMMQKAYTEDPANKFVRAVNAAPEPAVVVTTDRQLHDIARFCTSPLEFSPLTLDPTFCLGEFDVMLIIYIVTYFFNQRSTKPHQYLLVHAAFTIRSPLQHTCFLFHPSFVNANNWKESRL